jgi:hypothetical protein
MEKESLNSESGSSFVESLITIIVAGMACVAFISVTASIVRETKNQEIQEYMTDYALNGLDRVRAINSRNQGYKDLEGEEYSLADITYGVEYSFTMDDGELVLLSSLDDLDCPEDGGCEELDLDDGDDFFYRKVILERMHSTSSKVLRATVEVGRLDPTADDNLNSYQVEGFIATL